uniref:Uncharacterized protein n=1 Tax=Candidatus Kentrum sp. LFY TaxID=2126342 RepID=A0A450UB80_9GAMM|nr:MAG: hypothetical protein BECKLFY1418A_GA0070994_100265 [Candidatus Kentron sp. LFY]VFJ89460.1 MAG: hypothetical protein BECKLFY1418B_GA0070995_101524 [Candidatus Kentron sp. LFY]VFK14691.1 MAG: hypothetical protein BECKLFY1418C_GA0070996_101022 [Candidatus Kentron sp. LFY]
MLHCATPDGKRYTSYRTKVFAFICLFPAHIRKCVKLYKTLTFSTDTKSCFIGLRRSFTRS